MAGLFGKENHFNYGGIRRYVVMFGSLFSDMYIKRTEEPKKKKETFIKVPIKYGLGNVFEKFGEVDDDKTRLRIVLPAMSFVMSGLEEDTIRKTSNYARMSSRQISDDQMANTQLQRVPYNFTFDLAIRTKNEDDMLQIVEQIVPAFDPALTVQVLDSKELNIDNQDIVIQILPGFDMQDNEEDQVEEGRVIVWTLQFIVKGYLYKKTTAKAVVKQIAINEIDEQGVFIQEIMSFLSDSVPEDITTVIQQKNVIENNLFEGTSSV